MRSGTVALTRKSILHFNLLDGGIVVAVARFHRDFDRLHRLMDQNPGMIDYSISSEFDDLATMIAREELPTDDNDDRQQFWDSGTRERFLR